MPQDVTDEELQRLVSEGVSQREIARRTGFPRATLQNRLKRLQVYEVHRGTPSILPRRTPAVDLRLHTPADLDAIKVDLLEVVEWWRARKMRRVDPRRPRTTQRQTWHVDVRWIEAVKEAADVEGVPQAEIIDRALRQYFEPG
jgi:DNA-binding Lrp family transcriptional regulator